MPGKLWQATWGRAFAALYDPAVRGLEEAGFADTRRGLLAEAAGRTLEIGAGTGLNLRHYPEAVTELVLAEPDAHMAARLRDKVGASGRRANVVQASAERLPFEDGSFDSAVATLVLCTVPDPVAALRELARVLRPGGRFLFAEHVRSDDPGLARWQDRAAPITNWAFCGCHPNRATLAAIEASPLAVERVERGELPKKGSARFERPLIVGAARLPG